MLTLFAACSDYDDSKIWDSLNGIKERVAALETTVGKLNADLTAMQTIVDKLNANVYVSKVDENADGSHTIYFTDGKNVVITNGKDGSDAPTIGIKADSDGRYYWTITVGGKTDWLLDAADGKMPVTGDAGTPPQLKIDDKGFWIVSYDGWKTKNYIYDEAGEPVSALGKDGVGDSFFKDVEQDADNVYLTLMDGTVITIAKRSDFYLLVKLAPVKATFAYGETKTYDVESVGVVDVVLTKPFGWSVTLADDVLTIKAPAEADMCEKDGQVAIVYFSDNQRSSVVKMDVVIDKDYTGTTTDANFTVTLTEITDGKVVADVTPSNPDVTYYIYPNSADQTDDKCVTQMMKRFKADIEYGETPDYFWTGEKKGYVYSNLSPDVEYTLSVIGVKYDKAAKTLEELNPRVIMRVPFTTKGPEIINTTFLMSLSDITWYGASCAVHPSDDLPYFHAFVKKAELDEAYDDASYAQDFIDNRYYYPWFDEVFDYGWSAFTVHGDRTLTSPGFLMRDPLYISEDVYPLEPDTEYYAIALGCNDSGEFSNAKIGRKAFRTKAFVPSKQCSFTIETSVEKQDITVKVIPSDNTVSYISFIDERDNYSEHFAQAVQYPPYDMYWRMQNLEGSQTIADSQDFYKGGEANYTVVNLKASTRYIVYAYGCTADGVITTAPEIVEVSTRGTIDDPYGSPAVKQKGRSQRPAYRVIRK